MSTAGVHAQSKSLDVFISEEDSLVQCPGPEVSGQHLPDEPRSVEAIPIGSLRKRQPAQLGSEGVNVGYPNHVDTIHLPILEEPRRDLR
jgi:hypothetical protein